MAAVPMPMPMDANGDVSSECEGEFGRRSRRETWSTARGSKDMRMCGCVIVFVGWMETGIEVKM